MLEAMKRIKSSLKSNDATVVVGWNEIPAGMVIEALAARFDLVAVDLQHGLMDFEGALNLLAIAQRLGKPLVCRVPSLERGLIAKLLDAGYLGIIAPIIETESDARDLIRAASYPPLGERSYGPIRARRLYGERYGSRANEAIMNLAMVETKRGVDNLESILSVDGIDGIYVGPADLALSMGLNPGLDSASSEVADAIEWIRRRTIEAGKIVGIHCSGGPSARKYLEQGFSLVGMGTDIGLLEYGISQHLDLLDAARQRNKNKNVQS